MRPYRERLESTEEADVRKWALAEGWETVKVGRDGWPDRVFIRGGLHVWIEMKRAKTGRASVLQGRRIESLRKHGARAFIHAGRDAAIGRLMTEWDAHLERQAGGL